MSFKVDYKVEIARLLASVFIMYTTYETMKVVSNSKQCTGVDQKTVKILTNLNRLAFAVSALFALVSVFMWVGDKKTLSGKSAKGYAYIQGLLRNAKPGTVA